MADKTLLQSKTFWFNFLTALMAAIVMLVPAAAPAGDFLKSHMDGFAMAWGIIGIVLRLATKGAIVLGD